MLPVAYATPEQLLQQPLVELKVSQRLYEGRIGDKPSCFFLIQMGGEIKGTLWGKEDSGSTCTAKQLGDFREYSLKNGTPFTGTWASSGEVVLNELDALHLKPTGAVWQLRQAYVTAPHTTLSTTYLSGIHGSQDIHFQQVNNTPDFPEFPFDMYIVLSSTPQIFTYENAARKIPDIPALTAIRLYQNDALVQELPTASQGSMSIWLPIITDLNFDGHPDLMLVSATDASGWFYDTWLYNAITGNFENTTETTQNLTNIELDARHQQIISSKTSGPFLYSIATYRWNQQALQQQDSQTGYFMPIKVRDELKYCFITPEYARNSGKIIYPVLLVESATDLLELQGDLHLEENTATNHCMRLDALPWKPFSPPYIQTLVWGQKGEQLELKRTYGISNWEQLTLQNGTPLQWCPQVPYFDLNTRQISHQVDISACQNEKPVPGETL